VSHNRFGTAPRSRHRTVIGLSPSTSGNRHRRSRWTAQSLHRFASSGRVRTGGL